MSLLRIWRKATLQLKQQHHRMETGCGDKDKRRPPVIVEEEEEEEEEEILKKRISHHPLFGLLIETHFSCLKVGLREFGEVGVTAEPGRYPVTHSESKNDYMIDHNPSDDLDLFMKTYCMALKKLKEEVEEVQKECASFIDATYLKLRDLTPNNYL